MASSIDPSKLARFAGAAAGHDGVLSDDSGDLVIKPCTPAEVAFYEEANASHAEFAYFMPAFMGTLRLGDQTPHIVPTVASNIANGIASGVSNGISSGISQLVQLNLPWSHAPSSSIPPEDSPAITDGDELRPLTLAKTHESSSSLPGIPEPTDSTLPSSLRGKKLDTDLHIVLQNISAGFVQPNIMDLKLGARLWDDDAPPEKRARLDKVAAETTSGSLGFRIAGMRVWQGPRKAAGVDKLEDVVRGISDEGSQQHWQLDAATNYRNYNKFYGRTFNADTVINGFKEYLYVPNAGVSEEQAVTVAANFVRDVQELQEVLEGLESRIYSASILLVYEGNPAAFERAVEAQKNAAMMKIEVGEDNQDEDEEEDEDAQLPKFFAVKLIDFAHARFEKGAGPDVNMLHGIKSTIKMLERLTEDLSG